MSARYAIRRLFFRDDVESYTHITGLTLEEAQEHCSDPETSSSTCEEGEGSQGPWFDSYSEE